MRLYMPAATEYARYVIDNGFVGIPTPMYDSDELEAAGHGSPRTYRSGEAMPPLPEPKEWKEWCIFRDMPPGGLTFSRTTEMSAEHAEDGVEITVEGGPVLADDMGDFVLSVDIPDDIAAEYRVYEEEPLGWPFQEYYVEPDLANRYRHTLTVYDWNIDGGYGTDDDLVEIRPDLVGK